MNIRKGTWLYIGSAISLVLLMLSENSTMFFDLSFGRMADVTIYSLLPDLISIAVLIGTYGLLTLIYKKHSIYRRVYPVFALLVVVFWTIMVYIK